MKRIYYNILSYQRLGFFSLNSSHLFRREIRSAPPPPPIKSIMGYWYSLPLTICQSFHSRAGKNLPLKNPILLLLMWISKIQNTHLLFVSLYFLMILVLLMLTHMHQQNYVLSRYYTHIYHLTITISITKLDSALKDFFINQ